MNVIEQSAAAYAFTIGVAAGLAAGSPGWAKMMRPERRSLPGSKRAPSRFEHQAIPRRHDDTVREQINEMLRRTRKERERGIEQAKAALANARLLAA
jgi:hypothetical protein